MRLSEQLDEQSARMATIQERISDLRKVSTSLCMPLSFVACLLAFLVPSPVWAGCQPGCIICNTEFHCTVGRLVDLLILASRIGNVSTCLPAGSTNSGKFYAF